MRQVLKAARSQHICHQAGPLGNLICEICLIHMCDKGTRFTLGAARALSQGDTKYGCGIRPARTLFPKTSRLFIRGYSRWNYKQRIQFFASPIFQARGGADKTHKRVRVGVSGNKTVSRPLEFFLLFVPRNTLTHTEAHTRRGVCVCVCVCVFVAHFKLYILDRF